MRLLSLSFVLFLVGCPTVGKESDTEIVDADADGDGYPASQDCNDADSTVNPGADEVCDGADNNCDEKIDDATAVDGTTFYADVDGDGYGVDDSTTIGCAASTGYSAESGDCDDTNILVHPGATEDDCTDTTDYNCDGSVGAVDQDGDGYFACTECDDSNGAINPGAAELCDGIDNNCEGSVDENPVDGTVWYADNDADGYGDPSAATVTACSQPTGYVSTATDCKDTDAAYHPGASEADCTDPNDYNCDGSAGLTDTDADGFVACSDCNDGDAAINASAAEVCDSVDNNCDGNIDENVGNTNWYYDFDKDGYGDSTSVVVACTAPEGYVGEGADCDDADPSVHPNALEQDCADPKDYNCDGSVGQADADADGLVACTDCNDADAAVGGLLTFYADGDADGFGNVNATAAACAVPAGYSADSLDCDDTNATVNPAGVESCDGLDNDCNGAVDDAPGSGTWYMDMDADGFGDANSSMEACSQPIGYVGDNTDCNDADPSVNPISVEVCDGLDNDCNGTADDNAADGTTFYMDMDADGYGDGTMGTTACSAPTGYVADGSDCDDTNGQMFPGNIESCDNVDNDCNGAVDDNAADALTWYQDADGDAFGDASVTMVSCVGTTGWVLDNLDCNDADAAINPGAAERCDGLDNDCDGTVDQGAVDASTWYTDADGDGYGDSSTGMSACTQPSGTVADATDCNDADVLLNPGATEVCDGLDNDCNGTVDQGAADAITWYADSDGDTYGDPNSTLADCGMPMGYTSDSNDCNDSSSTVFPGAEEYCNGVDDNCNGTVDGATEALDGATWYADSDADTYGNASSTKTACNQPTGYVGNATDCDDTKSAVNPGASELCNGTDDNCNGVTDEPTATDAKTWYADADGDTYGGTTSQKACSKPSGYVSTSTDCNDNNAAINPAASEVCDGVDNNCNGNTDDSTATDAKTWYADADADGYGGTTTSKACTQPTGYLATSTDCNDASAAINPGAQEVCDGSNVDEDCDGNADDKDASVLASTKSTFYADADGDTYGSSSSTVSACDKPTGYVATGTDCNDSAATAYPGASEIARDTYDNNCNGVDDSRLTGLKTVSSASASLVGGANQDVFGSAMSNRGDVNGDGYDDVLVGANGYDSATSNVGRAYLFNGSASGATFVLASASATVTGTAAGDGLGEAVSIIGDTNADGYDDVAINIYKYDYGTQTESGGVILLRGGSLSGALTPGNATITYKGARKNDYAGWVVGPAGDQDLDGRDEWLFTAYLHDGVGAVADVGRLEVVDGALASGTYVVGATGSYKAQITGTLVNGHLGTAADGGGDFNADGYPDIVVSAPVLSASAGEVYAYFGPLSGDYAPLDADVTVTGSLAGDELGNALASVGDVSGDGTDDVLVAAHKRDSGAASDVGAVFLFNGTASPSSAYTLSNASASLTGLVSSDFVGRSVAGAGDVDFDGNLDILIGATGLDNGTTSGTGGAALIYGPISGSTTLTSGVVFYGGSASEAAGLSLAGGGDVNGDDYSDYLIGANTKSGANTNGGAYLFYGIGQ